MADPTKGWHAVFDKGSKQAQEKLKKAHGHKPEFQAFLKSRGAEGGERSAKQATTSLKKATDAKIAAQKIADMRFKKALQVSSDRVREMGRRRRESGEGLGGGLESNRDIVAYVKQHGSIKAGRLGEETMNEVTKKEAEVALGGPVKDKPKGPAGKLPLGFRMARSAARKAMRGAVSAVHKSMEKTMQKEDVNEAIKDAADKGEYDYEGDMAKSQLRSIMANSKRMHDMLEENTNLPEWVQSKITLAEDYISTAANYMEGEMNEEVKQIDEGADRWEYSGTVNGKDYTITVPRGADLSDHLGHKKIQRENPHLEPHEVKAVADTSGEDEEHVEVEHGGKKYTHRVTNNQEPRMVYSEEVEQVDEKINLVKAKMGDVVKDFYKSKAPQFRGKSKAKRREMAVAAKLGAEREAGMREEVEQVKEGAKDWKKAFSAVAQKNLQKDVGAMRSKVGRLNYIGMQPKVDATPKVTAALTKKGTYAEEVVTEAEGTVAVTPKEKSLAAHHGDPKKITYGDVIKARLKSAAAKKMGK